VGLRRLRLKFTGNRISAFAKVDLKKKLYFSKCTKMVKKVNLCLKNIFRLSFTKVIINRKFIVTYK